MRTSRKHAGARIASVEVVRLEAKAPTADSRTPWSLPAVGAAGAVGCPRTRVIVHDVGRVVGCGGCAATARPVQAGSAPVSLGFAAVRCMRGLATSADGIAGDGLSTSRDRVARKFVDRVPPDYHWLHCDSQPSGQVPRARGAYPAQAGQRYPVDTPTSKRVCQCRWSIPETRPGVY